MKPFYLTILAIVLSFSAFAIGPIVGPTLVCPGTSVTFSCSGATSGTWSTTSPIASISSGTGVFTVIGTVTGSTPAVIDFTDGSAVVSTTITIIPATNIVGPSTICDVTCTQLSSDIPGGIWSCPPIAAGTVSATGLLCGLTAGTVTVSYSIGTGCVTTKVVTINPLPSAIVGPSTVCLYGPYMQFSSATAGGTWSTSNSNIATMTPTSSLLVPCGIILGGVNVNYSVAGCTTQKTVTVLPAPAYYPVTGGGSYCDGSGGVPIGLSGSETSVDYQLYNGSTPVGSPVPGTGSAISFGLQAAAGSYSVRASLPATGCSVASSGVSVFVNSLPPDVPVTGGGTYCPGSPGVSISVGLAASHTGVSYQLFGPGMVPVGTAVAGGGGPVPLPPVTAAGTYSVSATNMTTGCYRWLSTTATVTVGPTIGPVAGPSTMCAGSVATFSNATPGGTWSSNNYAVATIVPIGGIATAVAPGIANISYGFGGCVETKTITVNPTPLPIAGPSTLCNGSFIQLSCTTVGGSWSSSNTSIATIDVSGLLVGMTQGATTVSYTIGNGCFSIKNVIVNPTPSSITGPSTVCNNSCTQFSSAPAGGVWSSSNPVIGSVGASGILCANSIGMFSLSYTLGGCSQTRTITVNPIPLPITGPSTLCAGSSGTLGNMTPGGVWSTNNILVATVSPSTGIVWAVAPGTVNGIYTLPTGCSATHSITVVAAPVISGPPAVCNGGLVQLSTNLTGGTWTSSNFGVAAVGVGTGLVSAVGTGSAVIQYMTASCWASHSITVLPTPTITGPSSVCDGMTVSLSSTSPGGSWSSSISYIATVSSSGVVAGISPGVTNISYMLGSGCAAVMSFTVHPLAPTTGATTICAGNTTTLSNSVAGGAWTSSDPSVASINPFSPVAYGISGGTAIISYSLLTGCTSTLSLTVNTTPTIYGVSAICTGGVAMLSSDVVGGIWTSSNATVANVTAGVVTGLSAGLANISYTASTGCSSGILFTIHPSPSYILAIAPVCVGSSITLSNTLTGGSWSVTPSSVATIDASGNLFGVGAGTALVSYSSVHGCMMSASVAVGAAATASVSVSPTTTFCAGDPTTFTATTTAVTSPSYQWYLNSTVVPGAVGAAYTSSTLAPGDVVSVQVTATATCDGSTVTPLVSTPVTVHPLPTVAASSASGCDGTYNISATGTGVSYQWSPIAGLSCSTCAATLATISSSTAYTVIATDGNGCTAADAILLNGNRISGNINYTGVSTDSFRVWLIKYNPIDSTVTALDSTVSCMDGGTPYYEFTTPASGSYMVKAMLFGTLPGTSGYVPTYGLSSASWFGATTITHTTATDVQPIIMVYGTVPAGPGFIAGNVYSGAGKGTSGDAPVEGMVVYLRNTATQVLTYTYTTASGSYYFGDLAYGSYVIYPEEFDFYTTPSAVITLSAATPSATGINFKQHTDNGTITPMGVTLVQGVKQQNAISAYPNPAQNEITLQWNGLHPGTGDIVVTDLAGRTAMQKTLEMKTAAGTTTVDISGLSSGLYIVSFRSGDVYHTQKLTVEK